MAPGRRHVGGPLVRNKFFYFGSYQGFRQDFSNTFLIDVPTAAQREGVFNSAIRDPRTGQPFANNTIPRDRWDPLAARLLALFPAPNLAGRPAAGGRVTENYGVQRPGENDAQGRRPDRLLHVAGRPSIFRYSLLQQDVFREQILEGPGDGSATRASSTTATRASA